MVAVLRRVLLVVGLRLLGVALVLRRVLLVVGLRLLGVALVLALFKGTPREVLLVLRHPLLVLVGL